MSIFICSLIIQVEYSSMFNSSKVSYTEGNVLGTSYHDYENTLNGRYVTIYEKKLSNGLFSFAEIILKDRLRKGI